MTLRFFLGRESERGEDVVIALPLRWNKQCVKLSRLQTYVNLLLPIAELIPTEEISELLSPTANFALVQPGIMCQCQSNLTPHTICPQASSLALGGGGGVTEQTDHQHRGQILHAGYQPRSRLHFPHKTQQTRKAETRSSQHEFVSISSVFLGFFFFNLSHLKWCFGCTRKLLKKYLITMVCSQWTLQLNANLAQLLTRTGKSVCSAAAPNGAEFTSVQDKCEYAEKNICSLERMKTVFCLEALCGICTVISESQIKEIGRAHV